MIFESKKSRYIALVIMVFLLGGCIGWGLGCTVYGYTPNLPTGNVSCQIQGDTLVCDFGGFREYSAGSYVGFSYEIEGEVLTIKAYHALFAREGPMGINPIQIQDKRLEGVTQVQFASHNEMKPVKLERILTGS